jgi:hypothetical protein
MRLEGGEWRVRFTNPCGGEILAFVRPDSTTWRLYDGSRASLALAFDVA